MRKVDGWQFFFSSRRRHTRSTRDWSSDVCSSDLMGYFPENTLASFERGLELGADWIEMDVHLSRDGALIVIHDETLDRTTNGHGYIKDHTLTELRRLDAGNGQRIPTLDEVLDWAYAKSTTLDIEIKNAPLYYDGIEAKVVRALDDHGMTEQ